MEDKTPGFKEKFGKDKNLMAEKTRKKKWLVELLGNK